MSGWCGCCVCTGKHCLIGHPGHDCGRPRLPRREAPTRDADGYVFHGTRYRRSEGRSGWWHPEWAAWRDELRPTLVVREDRLPLEGWSIVQVWFADGTFSSRTLAVDVASSEARIFLTACTRRDLEPTP